VSSSTKITFRRDHPLSIWSDPRKSALPRGSAASVHLCFVLFPEIRDDPQKDG